MSNQTKFVKICTMQEMAYKMSHACNREWRGRRGLMIPNSPNLEDFRLLFGVRNLGTVFCTKTQKRERLYPQIVIFKLGKVQDHF